MKWVVGDVKKEKNGGGVEWRKGNPRTTKRTEVSTMARYLSSQASATHAISTGSMVAISLIFGKYFFLLFN